MELTGHKPVLRYSIHLDNKRHRQLTWKFYNIFKLEIELEINVKHRKPILQNPLCHRTDSTIIDLHRKTGINRTIN